MGRKLTHEEFMEKFYRQNKHAKDIQILGTYVNQRTKIKCKCKVCGYEWEVIPSSLLQGYGCFKCGREIAIQKCTKTHEEFLQELQQVNSDIEILETYINYSTKIKCRGRVCGHEWEAWPNHLLKGHACPKCSMAKAGEQRRKTHEQFIQELQEVNSDIEILGTYANAHTKIKCKCKIDEYEWETKPAILLQGNGCPKCGTKNRVEKRTKTHEQFIKDLHQVNPDIEILGTYINNHTKIKCRCRIDGYEWEPTPSDLLNGYGCHICGAKRSAQKQSKTHEQFIEELKQINQDIEILGTYINCSTKIKCKCRLDGHIWETTPNSLLQGNGCPKCNITKGEKRVAQYLDNLGIDYIYNTCYFKDLVSVNGGVMRPDFIIPTLKIWVEYDGIQHFKPVDFSSKMSAEQVQAQFKKVQQNDQIKNQYAKDNNWTLIRIPYWDIDNIEQILDSYLKQEEELAL